MENCTVEANGTSISCACSGCGIVYASDTKSYTILCCGTVTTMKTNNQHDPSPRPHLLEVDLSNVSLLEAAKLLDKAVPGKITLEGTFDHLKKKVTHKGTETFEKLVEKLGLLLK